MSVKNAAKPGSRVIKTVINHETGELMVCDNDGGDTIAYIRADKDSGKFILRPAPGAIVDTSGVGAGQFKSAEYDHTPEKGEINVPRNWKIDGERMVIWNPQNDAEIVLDRASAPGERTPSGVPEIYGQPELLFEVAMGISLGQNVLLSGPTGTGKTTVLAWFAQQLNYNLVPVAITPKTEAAHLVGEYLPGPEAGSFPFIYGPVAVATRLSQTHPTILVLDELSRIGNVAETAGILPLLDGQRRLEIPQHPNATSGEPEVLVAGDLVVTATMNPADSDDDEVGGGDYIGVTELDPALSSRFAFHPPVGYPPEDVEAAVLADRTGVPSGVALSMVQAINKIRHAAHIRFPVSFRELEGWARAYPYVGYARGAEIAVTRKAHPSFRTAIAGILNLTRV